MGLSAGHCWYCQSVDNGFSAIYLLFSQIILLKFCSNDPWHGIKVDIDLGDCSLFIPITRRPSVLTRIFSLLLMSFFSPSNSLWASPSEECIDLLCNFYTICDIKGRISSLNFFFFHPILWGFLWGFFFWQKKIHLYVGPSILRKGVQIKIFPLFFVSSILTDFLYLLQFLGKLHQKEP